MKRISRLFTLVIFFLLTFVTSVLALEPNDSYFSSQWHLQKISAPQAWDITSAANVKVAIIDSGIDTSHPDLPGIVASANFSTSSYIEDHFRHGTSVAGIIGATTNNMIGVASVGNSTQLLSAKLLDDNGGGNPDRLGEAITWAVDNGADVILANILASSLPNGLIQAVDYANSHGVLIVAPVGNSGSQVNCQTVLVYPACLSTTKTNVISVAGSNQQDNLFSASDYGSWIDVAAPAVDIWTTSSTLGPNPSGSCTNGSDSSYCIAQYNSYAAPQVAAVAALVYNMHPSWTPQQVKEQLKVTADLTGNEGSKWSSGRVNAYRAVTERSEIKIWMAGVNYGGYPTAVLNIDGVDKVSFPNVAGNPATRTFVEYTYIHPTRITTPGQVRIKFANDWFARDLMIDKISIDGVVYEAEDITTLSEGSGSNGAACASGFFRNEWMYCGGSMRFGQTPGSEIKVYMAGTPNGAYPTAQIKVNGALGLQIANIQGSPANRQFIEYTYVHTAPVTPNQLTVHFTNDSGPRDLVVDKVTIDGVTYETESPTTYGIGVWANNRCNVGGNYQSEWLHCLGYFRY